MYALEPCNLQNCTIYGNTPFGVYGGGREFSNGIIDHCTFYQNDAFGVRCHWRTSIMNCIIWKDVVGQIISQPFVSSCLLTQPLVVDNAENNIVTNPLFVDEGVIDFTRYKTVEIMGEEFELPDFIVQRPDLQLLPGSPAIDRGDPVAFDISDDKDGVDRPCWNWYDIGAYEYCGDIAPYTVQQFIRGDVNGDGKLNLADAIFILQYLYVKGRAPGCLDAADTNDDGDIDLGDAISLLGYLYTDAESPSVSLALCGPDNTEDELSCEFSTSCE